MARYIINAGGVLNSVADEDFAIHLAVARQTALQRQNTPDAALGAQAQPVAMPREATPEEVAAWWAAQGLVYDPATSEATPASEVKPVSPAKPAK